MPYELGLLPSGQLHLFTDDEAAPSPSSQNTRDKISASFVKHGTAKGMLALSALQTQAGLGPSFQYWKSFADQYMTQLCQLSDAQPWVGLAVPDAEDIRHLLGRIPPMKGAEYVSETTLCAIWQQLDEFVRGEVSEAFNQDLNAFLKKTAPHWHQAGRVCFHLAENSNDPDYPFAFMASYLPESSGQSNAQHQLLGKALQEYAGAKNKSRLIHLLSPVDRASKVSPLIHALVESGDIYHPMAWTPNDAYQFLQQASLFENCGIQVRLPDWWKKRPQARVSVTLGTESKNTLNLSSLLQFDVNLAIGDHQLTASEWERLLEGDDRLVLINKQWVEVDQEKLGQALSHWRNVEQQVAAEGITFIEGMRLLAGAPTELLNNLQEDAQHQWFSVQASQQLNHTLQQIRHPETLKDTQPDKALKASLRPYQRVGVNWLWYLHQLGLGACLADDMGLGKTIQIIALLLKIKQSNRKKKAQKKPSLIVLPASLIGNWQEELFKFAPSLINLTIHPSSLSKNDLTQYQQGQSIASYDIILTSYSMLLRQEWLLEYEWQLVVLDEAQAIKNPGARQTKAAKKLQAHSKIALTGTPVENRLSDLWSLYDFICPGLLGKANSFKKYAKSLAADSENSSRQGYAPLRNLIQPYLLRRLKTDQSIISDLPDKTEVRAYCRLSKQQASLYQRSVRELSKKLAKTDGIERRGLVLSYLMRFKQICNHPAQLLGDGDYKPTLSGKFARLDEICEEISARQEKVLVFTQFRTMCAPLAEFLANRFQRPGLILHGGVPVKKRQTLVAEFQQEDGPPFFVLSLKAGGTGLNLTAASHVIHFDRWWNPAVENQATDRAYRIGQHKNVLVHKFICKGTVEEKIDSLIEEKTTLATDLLEGEGGEKLLTELSDQALIELVTLDLDVIN